MAIISKAHSNYDIQESWKRGRYIYGGKAEKPQKSGGKLEKGKKFCGKPEKEVCRKPENDIFESWKTGKV